MPLVVEKGFCPKCKAWDGLLRWRVAGETCGAPRCPDCGGESTIVYSCDKCDSELVRQHTVPVELSRLFPLVSVAWLLFAFVAWPALVWWRTHWYAVPFALFASWLWTRNLSRWVDRRTVAKVLARNTESEPGVLW